jgi:beta-phosphoglucomutase
MNTRLAVIFDMDGVLIDSYEAHFRSWGAVAKEEGHPVTEEEFGRTFGRTSREIIATLWSETSRTDAQIAEIDARKEARYRELIAANIPAMPGARGLLQSLREAGFALAVGSSAPPENVDLTLDGLGWRSLFDAVVTGADVTHGKPDPEVFLTAVARLSVLPEHAVVIEDAPPGIEAAKAAGMAAVGLASTGRTRKDLVQADLIVDSLDALSPAVLRKLILGRE